MKSLFQSEPTGTLVIPTLKDALQRIEELEESLARRSSPFPRAENFSVHELIDPRDTRKKLIEWLDLIIETRKPPVDKFKTTMLP